MQSPHPSGRPSTHIPLHIRPWLIAPTSGPLPPRALTQDAWLRAKERQLLEDGTSARIEHNRMDRLSGMINGTPLDRAGSAEIHLLSNRRNLLCQKFGFQSHSTTGSKGGVQ